MNNQDFIKAIEFEWELGVGFFGKLRNRKYDKIGFDRVLRLLKQFRFDSDFLDKDIVALLWYIPMFMEWQTENMEITGVDISTYEQSKNLIMEQLEMILGVP